MAIVKKLLFLLLVFPAFVLGRLHSVGEVGRRGATKEVEDVEEELEKMRALEVVMEKDLASILASVTSHSKTLVHMEAVLAAAADTHGDGKDALAALRALAESIQAHPSNLTDLSRGLMAMRRDLALLVRSLNSSETELNEVREVTGQKEIVEGLQGGKIEVDYETGKIGHATNRLTHLANVSSSWSVTALTNQLAAATAAADPAVLHLDIQLLQDLVILCLASAVGGLLAAFVSLPHTLGYILGGMLVGPSCLDFIKQVVQTETLSQFGSIFMLFGHGLVYSQHYRAPHHVAHVSSDALGSGSSHGEGSTPIANANIAGPGIIADTITGSFVFVVSLFTMILLLLVSTNVVSSWLEGTLMALALSLSSTYVVMDTLVNTRLRDTLYGTVIIEIMAVQDLFMAPLLAVPTALSHIAWQQSPAMLAQTLLIYSAGIIAVVVASRILVPRFMQVLTNPESSLAPQLFTLAVSAYCLGMSLLFEWLELSHEAGALFAGLVLMDTPHVQKAAVAVEPLTSLFGGMYLASLGMIMSPTFLLNHLSMIMSYVVALYILKVAVMTCVMRSFGFTVPAALSAGVVLAQVSEVSLFFIARSQQLGLVSRSVYLLMLATTVTLLAVAPLASNVVKRVDKREFSNLETPPPSTAVLNTGGVVERERRSFLRRTASVFFSTFRALITWPFSFRRRHNEQRGV